MCGIAGIYLRDPSLHIDLDAALTTMLDEIEARGQHATGFVAITDDGVGEWQKASCDATTFNKHRRSVPRDTRVLLAHTRWATQGEPAFMENNHPIKRGPFFIIHNGHVSNDDDLFIQAERNRFGQVDSEAIAAHLAHLGDLSKLDEVMSAIDGDAAVAAVDERDHMRLAVARGNSSPLWIYNGRRVVIFGSTESTVIKTHAKHVGAISARRLFFAKEGDFYEWKDKVFIARTFTPKKRWTWVSTGTGSYKSASGSRYTWDDWEWDDGKKAWSTSKAVEKWSARHADDDVDVVACDACGQVMFWDEAEYRWVRGENVSFMLCGTCADAVDENGWVELVGDYEDDEDDDDFESRVVDDKFSFRGETRDNDDAFLGGPVDNYADANESIVASFARKLLNRKEA